MTISLLFSAAIYELSFREVNDKLEQLQTQLERRDSAQILAAPLNDAVVIPHNPRYTALRNDLLGNARGNLVLSLFYINLLIFTVGGTASYLLARRTLRHIEAHHDAQSRFTSDASHELRTPLAAMRSEIEVMLRDPSTSKADLRETLESNLEEVNNLSRLSQLLLELSKADHASIPLTSVRLEDVVSAATARLTQSGGRITLETSSNMPPIHANATGLEELFTILLDNALKYSPDDTPVTITLKRRSYRAFIEITNQGHGIEAKDAPHIFERFYRADHSRTHGRTAGYGLGLALAKKIVELHNGELSVKSIIDQTTTFTVILPLDRRDFAPSHSSWWHAAKNALGLPKAKKSTRSSKN